MRRSARRWRPERLSDPLRYADWFEKNAEVRRRLLERDASASVAPVPAREPANLKAPLRKIIQIIKRARDLDFIGVEEIPSSILITTMASRAYRGEEDLAEGLDNVLRAMNAAIKSARPNRAIVLNPTNSNEDFAKAPSQACYDKFANLIDKISAWINKAMNTPPGRRNIQPVLEEAMGKSAVAKAFNSLEASMKSAHDGGKLGAIAGGGLTILTESKASGGVQPVRSSDFHLKH